MTPQEIKENNILLAEFLGWEVDRDPNQINPSDILYVNSTGLKTPYQTVYVKDMEFHKDWNWLMLVVDKIENTDSPKEGLSWNDYKPFSAQIDRCDCQILVDGLATGHKLRGDDVPYIGSDRKSESKIEAVYEACVQFVKWYGQNKGGN